MQAIEGRANMALISAIVAVATIGGLLFGYDSGAVNGTQPADCRRKRSVWACAGLGFTVGSLLIGCAVGAFFAGTSRRHRWAGAIRHADPSRGAVRGRRAGPRA
jgi:SP family sugar:H+ symporter-like MFS transporter